MPDQIKTLRDYAKAVSANLSRGDATELTHRSALENLLETRPGIDVTHEPRRIACGAPDYIVSAGPVTVGYIEAKDVGENLSKAERTEQLKRYLASLPNLILTDYVEFRWYTDGCLRETARLGDVGADGAIKTTRGSLEQVLVLLDRFLQHKSPSAATARELAERMAQLARMIREVTAATLAQGDEPGTLHGQYQAFKETLLPELTFPEFADMFAQTIAYGLFAARERAAGSDFTRESAAWLLPKSNPFLRSLFAHIAGIDLDDRVAWIVDDLAQVLADAHMDAIIEDFLARVRKEDPVVHFYETFLAEYDPRLREMRGVYYTPEPVVSYIVRSVDHLLKTKFDRPQGLADPNVLILDPACGTGTFLFGVVKLIHERMVEQGQAGGWNNYVEKHLLPRLFGFELLMAPYAIAHLKLGLLLEETGYEFKRDERLGIYLTNTLQEAVTAKALPFVEFISEEANAAADIKREKPIMVVLGNPPYSGHSANRGKWIDGLLKGRLPDGTKVPSYYEVDGQPLREKNPKWLQDDYVKFIRFGQWRIEQTGYGILAFISNNGYLDNPTFRGMRQQLMRAFSDIGILDLHGNARKREVAPDGTKDENVFDIQQGVAIGFFLKRKDDEGDGHVYYDNLWGMRERDKYRWLAEMDVSSMMGQKLMPESPTYLFVPQRKGLREEYEKGWKVTDVLPVNSVGIVTARDSLTIGWSAEEVLEKARNFASLPPEAAREKYNLGEDVRDWKVSFAQADLIRDGIRVDSVAPILYRPFDRRYTYYTGRSRGFICMPRPEVMRHMLARPNTGMVVPRRVEIAGGWQHCLVSDGIIEHVLVSLKTIDSMFPLYLYPDPRTNGDLFSNGLTRHPNLNPDFVADIEKRLGLKFISDGKGDLDETFGPDDIFAYIYAVLHCPTYRTRYAEFLKMDFPRAPLTSDRELFRRLVEKGAELVSLHLMESPLLEKLITKYPIPGSNTVEKVRYDELTRRVYINKDQYFEGVEPEVWDFHIGGYHVLEKWLKDRRERKLTWEDQQHYQKIVVALNETMRLMGEIDEAIPSWPLS
ncbi:MAG: N-6 DNA methylase [Armatimonadetes bacterium]|nr:N-6 DNA methylase [Armatimonadota bacterium]